MASASNIGTAGHNPGKENGALLWEYQIGDPITASAYVDEFCCVTAKSSHLCHSSSGRIHVLHVHPDAKKEIAAGVVGSQLVEEFAVMNLPGCHNLFTFYMTNPSMSKIFIIGATGYFGTHLVQASVKLGHPTFALVRPITASVNPDKISLIQSFKNSGVTVLFGDLSDHEWLVEAIKKVDVVFSVLGHEPSGQLEQQNRIISAIKEAGNIKRFFPSEFGFDVDRVQVLEPAKSTLAVKVNIREAIRKEAIPFTFVSSNFCCFYFLSRLGQVEAPGIPGERVFILGDGNTRVVYAEEHDIATYAIKAADDERTLNKVLYVRPPANICSINELVSLWEEKKSTSLERIYLSEEEVLKKINESPEPLPFFYAIAHAGFIKGETTNFDIDPAIGVEASQLYPDVKYTTIEKYMDRFL